MRFFKQFKASYNGPNDGNVAVCYDVESRTLCVIHEGGTQFWFNVPVEEYTHVRQGTAFMPSILKLHGRYLTEQTSLCKGFAFFGQKPVDRYGHSLFKLSLSVWPDDQQAAEQEVPDLPKPSKKARSKPGDEETELPLE